MWCILSVERYSSVAMILLKDCLGKREVYKRSNRADVAYSNGSFITDSLAGIIKTLMAGTARQIMGRVMHF